jgi:hypothetical protein
VGRIDADDELSAAIAGKLKLAPILQMRGRSSIFFSRLAVQLLASSNGAFADGRMLPSRAVNSVSSGVARSGQISCRGAKARTKPDGNSDTASNGGCELRPYRRRF